MDHAAINACAALVERGDPDRFLAAMAAPVAARAALFPLYAFNLELARAPWVTREPLIARMRLQFWRDVVALEEPKAHTVAAPLQGLIRAGLPVAALNRMIDAREAEIGSAAPFGDAGALWSYLDGTGGALMVASVQALGGPESGAALDHGAAQALANYLLAVPALGAAGRRGLPEGSAAAALARQGLERLRRARPELSTLPRAALLAGWRAEGILSRAAKDPRRIAAGSLAESEFSRRGRLLWRVVSGF
ncbi:MAG: squalene/phytoene synthase family protein [Rhodobacteraceae bacterium]|nr:squalene/phytoene synthase family protein [Paracoccaceae bacterium]